jgi:hypothetical protein
MRVFLRSDESGYGRLRPPSRLSAALRPLARHCVALTAVLTGQQHATVRAKEKKNDSSDNRHIKRNGLYTESRTLPPT